MTRIVWLIDLLHTSSHRVTGGICTGAEFLWRPRRVYAAGHTAAHVAAVPALVPGGAARRKAGAAAGAQPGAVAATRVSVCVVA